MAEYETSPCSAKEGFGGQDEGDYKVHRSPVETLAAATHPIIASAQALVAKTGFTGTSPSSGSACSSSRSAQKSSKQPEMIEIGTANIQAPSPNSVSGPDLDTEKSHQISVSKNCTNIPDSFTLNRYECQKIGGSPRMRSPSPRQGNRHESPLPNPQPRHRKFALPGLDAIESRIVAHSWLYYATGSLVKHWKPYFCVLSLTSHRPLLLVYKSSFGLDLSVSRPIGSSDFCPSAAVAAAAASATTSPGGSGSDRRNTVNRAIALTRRVSRYLGSVTGLEYAESNEKTTEKGKASNNRCSILETSNPRVYSIREEEGGSSSTLSQGTVSNSSVTPAIGPLSEPYIVITLDSSQDSKCSTITDSTTTIAEEEEKRSTGAIKAVVECCDKLVREGMFKKAKLAPFNIHLGLQKHEFAAQTLGDREEWMKAITGLLSAAAEARTASALSSENNALAGHLGVDMNASVGSLLFKSIMSCESLPESNFASSRQKPVSIPLCQIQSEPEDIGALFLFGEKILTGKELGYLETGKIEALLHENAKELRCSGKYSDPWNDMYQMHVDAWRANRSRNRSHERTRSGSFGASSFNQSSESHAIANAISSDLRFYRFLGDFRHLAVTKGKEIIDRYHYTRQQMSPTDVALNQQEPCSFGNLVFSMDIEYATSSSVEIQCHVKNISNELLSINSLSNTVGDLHNALMCFIDYKGFRLVCYANMPLDLLGTRVFDLGVAAAAEYNAAATSGQHLPSTQKPEVIINSDALRRLNDSCEQLNLCLHGVKYPHMDSEIIMRGSSHMDVHCSRSNQSYYAVNLRNLFPVDIAREGAENIDQTRRLRPEHVLHYPKQLSSDAFVETGSSDQSECNTEVVAASRNLRDVVIVEFIRELDALRIQVADGDDLTCAMHARGINIRFLGFIASSSSLPHIKAVCYAEMIARAAKVEHARITRSNVLNYKRVEAKSIENELARVSADFFTKILTAEDSMRVQLFSIIKSKFRYLMSPKVYADIHRPALFSSLMEHCGVQFEKRNELHISSKDFLCFKARVKGLQPDSTISCNRLSVEERALFALAKHLALLGPAERFERNNVTAKLFGKVASAMLNLGNVAAAIKFAQAGLTVAEPKHICTADIQMTLCLAHFQSGTTTSQSLNYPSSPTDRTEYSSQPEFLAYIDRALEAVCTFWRGDHPLAIDVHMKAATIYIKLREYDAAIRVLGEASRTCVLILGKAHPETARYLLALAHLRILLDQREEAATLLTQSLPILSTVDASLPALALAQSLLADCLLHKGDYEKGTALAESALRFREAQYGPLDELTVDSHAQVAQFALALVGEPAGPAKIKSITEALTGDDAAAFMTSPLFLQSASLQAGKAAETNSPPQYDMTNSLVIMTPAMREAVSRSISSYMRIFKFHKQPQNAVRRMGLSIFETSSSGEGTNKVRTLAHASEMPLDGEYLLYPAFLGYTRAAATEGRSCGEAVVSTVDRGVCLLHLARRILLLKCLLLGPEHKCYLRVARKYLTFGQLQMTQALAEDVTNRLLHLTPTVFLDDCLSKVEKDDQEAMTELMLVVNLIDGITEMSY